MDFNSFRKGKKTCLARHIPDLNQLFFVYGCTAVQSNPTGNLSGKTSGMAYQVEKIFISREERHEMKKAIPTSFHSFLRHPDCRG